MEGKQHEEIIFLDYLKFKEEKKNSKIYEDYV
jgi:hypothetical protein